MKILIVSYAYLPRISGVAEVIYKLSRKLAESSTIESITILCAKYQDEPELEQDGKIKIIRYRTFGILQGRVPLISPDFISKLTNQLRNFRPNQIQTHTRFSIDTFLTLIWAKFYAIKAIHVEHLADFISGESSIVNSLSYLWDQTISRMIFSLSSQVVCVSSSVRDFIIQNLGANPDKTIVIENGCDFEVLPTTYHQKFADKKQFNIFYAARFVSLKNPMMVLEAIKLLSEKTQSFNFYLAGDGKLKPQMLEYIKTNSLCNTVYLGKLTSDQMAEQFAKSDIFLNPSRLEGLPGAVLEAVFCTNIVIASDIGGNRDILKIPQSLIPLKELSAKTLADKIEFFIHHHSEFLDQLEQNKTEVTNYFTWQRAAENYLKL
jgi:glycosyltransferase involved in cell wall biosynthesis